MSHDASQEQAGLHWYDCLFGAVIGGVTFLLAMLLVPAAATSPGEHDLALAHNLGFIFPPLVGLWAGLIQGSLRKLLICIGVGVVIGVAYKALCGSTLEGDDFIAVMTAYPSVLGAFAAAGMGGEPGSWAHGKGLRFVKGMLAGFILGVAYMVALNVIGFFMLPVFGPLPPNFDALYRGMMWKGGTLAMMIASGLFFPVFRWAAGLHRVRRQLVATKLP